MSGRRDHHGPGAPAPDNTKKGRPARAARLCARARDGLSSFATRDPLDGHGALHPMTRVRCEQIGKRFVDTVALDAIDLDVAPGELFFLLGPSGCGKSTLLRLIAGLLAPTSGRIRFDDRDVTALGTEQRNAVMCFQSYALWPHLTVRENVRFGLDVRGLGRAQQRERVDEVLGLVRMWDHASRKPNELSGGQQQRVALARALVVTPACLLLDEPLSNLDARLRLEMRGEIRRICKDTGVTTIYVTHEQKEALSIADRVAILDRGRIEQIGIPRDVYLRPATRFVASFIGETNLLHARVARRDGAGAELATPFGSLRSTALPAGPIAEGDEVTLSIRPESIALDGPPSAPNTFAAVVRESVYLGEIAQHVVAAGLAGTSLDGVKAPGGGVAAASGTLLKVFELNPRLGAPPGEPRRTTARVDPEDVVVLTR